MNQTEPPTRTPLARVLYLALAVFVALHNDVWWWDEPRLVLGLPIALTYHVAYCFAAVGLLSLLVRFAWPSHLLAESGVEVGMEVEADGGETP